jgi:hypothetical protein
MPRIFICYRREDTAGHAGRLVDALSARFGDSDIFQDVGTIGPGDDFQHAMSRALDSCKVFLALIGNQWLSALRPDGRRRIDDPDDHVCWEVREALARGVRVIPVLLAGAPMPRAAALPDPIAGLATRNAIRLDDEDWDTDVERLASAIREELKSGTPAAPLPSWLRRIGRWQIAGAALVLLAALVAANFNRGVPRETPTPVVLGTTVTLPAGGEAEVGEGVYEVLQTDVRPHGGGSTLALRVQMTNRGRYPVEMSDGTFRLLVGDGPKAPTSSLAKVVPANASEHGTVSFELPSNTVAATLRITAAGETGDIPLDLTGRSGPTAEAETATRRVGGTTTVVPIDPTAAEMTFGTLRCQLQSATVRRYTNKLTLTIGLRLHNRGQYPAHVGDSNFRLQVGGAVLAPVGGLNEVVQSEATRDGPLVFDVPLDARQAELRGQFGGTTVVRGFSLVTTQR